MISQAMPWFSQLSSPPVSARTRPANAGSSSVKVALFDEDLREIVKGAVTELETATKCVGSSGAWR